MRQPQHRLEDPRPLGAGLLPDGVAPHGTDNISYDMGEDGTSESGFGHPECSEEETAISVALPDTNPIGDAEPSGTVETEIGEEPVETH